MGKQLGILGTVYNLEIKAYEEDTKFGDRGWGGYCGFFDNRIVVCNLKTHPEFEGETDEAIQNAQKQCIRHEIVHAFLNESGLCDSSTSCEAWALNEEMVDWIAKQGTKIYEVWREAGAI